MLWEQQIEFASLSDTGLRRQNNQDSCAMIVETDRDGWNRNGHLFIVADGMGGHAVGELASKIAVDTLPLTYRKQRDVSMADALRNAMEAANDAIHERGSLNREFARMGTTCSALVLGPEGALIGHVGDSRVYRVRNGQIDQLTFDHSLQWEMMRRGKVSKEQILLQQPRHVITRSMGPEPRVNVDLEGPYPIMPGDVYLLCSDGLSGHLADEELGAILQELAPADACRFLINLANLRGGSDNITAVVVRVGAIPEGAFSDPRPTPDSGGVELSALGLGIAWGIAAFFCLGVILAVTGRVWGGATIATLSAIAAAILTARWLKSHPRPSPQASGHSTILWRSYRTAPARITQKMLLGMIGPQANLLQAAEEENWQFDRVEYTSACERAEAALAQKNAGAALREYSRAINALMLGLNRSRRKAGPAKEPRVSRLPPAGK